MVLPAITAILLACLVVVTDSFVPVQPHDPDWWKTTVIYQIYPRSYADSDGDGVGDLPGITSRLDYVQSLGVRAIWISPFYASPQDDMGYDVSNFTRVDPLFGTNEDFAVLIDEAHRRGIRVIMDLVPGHTSYKCEWFEKSRNRVAAYSDYYIWHAGDPKRPVFVSPSNKTRKGVPNNWVSVFGNSMWTWDEVRSEYYLHQFLKEQPDLNYRNPLVREEMQNIILFWIDRGVDGFRIDAFAHTFEEEQILNNDEAWKPNGPHDPTLIESLMHKKTKNLPETFLLLQEWQSMLKKYAAANDRDHIKNKFSDKHVSYSSNSFTVTEVYGETIDESMQYDMYNGRKGADFCFNFNLINITHANGLDIERAVNVWLAHVPKENGWPNWVTGNHDVWRAVSRAGGNPNLVDGLNMLLLMLPGTATSYFGEEIGMSNNYNITFEQLRDKNALTPAHILNWPKHTRDYERTPMQWTGRLPFAGFSPEHNSKHLPWLPVNENAVHGINVEEQIKNEVRGDQLPTTHLGVYKKLVQLRDRKPFRTSNKLTSALVTPTLYSFIRKDDEKTRDGAVPAYLIAVDVRRNGTESVQYNFLPALDAAYLSSFQSSRIILRSTIPSDSTDGRSRSSLWPLEHDKKVSAKIIVKNWAEISLLPGESFVAEFVI